MEAVYFGLAEAEIKNANIDELRRICLAHRELLPIGFNCYGPGVNRNTILKRLKEAGIIGRKKEIEEIEEYYEYEFEPEEEGEVEIVSVSPKEETFLTPSYIRERPPRRARRPSKPFETTGVGGVPSLVVTYEQIENHLIGIGNIPLAPNYKIIAINPGQLFDNFEDVKSAAASERFVAVIDRNKLFIIGDVKKLYKSRKTAGFYEINMPDDEILLEVLCNSHALMIRTASGNAYEFSGGKLTHVLLPSDSPISQMSLSESTYCFITVDGEMFVKGNILTIDYVLSFDPTRRKNAESVIRDYMRVPLEDDVAIWSACGGSSDVLVIATFPSVAAAKMAENSGGTVYEVMYDPDDDVIFFMEVPVPVRRNNSIIRIACGYNFQLFLDIKGNVYSRGINDRSQLGRGVEDVPLDEISETPEKVPIKDFIFDVSCGWYHSAVRSDGGYLYTFGANNYRQTGQSEELNVVSYPTVVDPEVFGEHNQYVNNVICGPYSTLLLNS